MKQDLFFVIDQGTTAHKLVVFDRGGRIIHVFEKMAPVAVAHDDGLSGELGELTAVSDALINLAYAHYNNRFFGFGFANQGETVVAWNKKTLTPLARAVSWQCHGAQDILEEKRDAFGIIRQTSGLMPSPYFSAAKLEKLMRTNARVSAAGGEGNLALATLDSWMIAHWTGGKTFVTDPTTACRTLLYDTFQGRWSEDLINLFNLRRDFFAEVLPDHQFEIVCTRGPFAGRPLPLLASLCDQPAALIGHGGLQGDCLKATLGTGAFIDLACRGVPQAPQGLLTSVLYADASGTAFYLEGGVLSFASAIERVAVDYRTCLNDALPFLNHDHGIHVLPAYSGLGAPHFRSDVSTIMDGVKKTHDGRHILAATLTGLIFRCAEIIDAMALLRELPDVLRVDGGLSQVSSLMQLMADACNKTIMASNHPHVTARGVAKTILDKIGRASSLADKPDGKIFKPQNPSLRERYREWRQFVHAALNRAD